MTKSKGISGTGLKIIAVISMLIDHFGAIFLDPTTIPYEVSRMIGRISFPIFCFLLVEGFLHTKNVKKYALRLALFAFYSEIPFDFAFRCTLFYKDAQNVLFTLLIGLMAVICLEYIEIHFFFKPVRRVLCYIATMAAWMDLAHFLKTDYSYFGVLVIGIFYLMRENRESAILTVCLLLCFQDPLELFAYFCVPLIYCYNGERGMPTKYFFYIFYPVHLTALGMLYYQLALRSKLPF